MVALFISYGMRLICSNPIFLLSVLIGLFSGCSKPPANDGRVFIFARGSDAHKLDPADVDDGESVNTVSQIFEGLVRFKSGTLEIEPWLAESYSISDDGKTYVFSLREGVHFHDGTPLTAETALYSFQRQMDPDHPGHFEEAAYSYWNYLYQDIEGVEASGPMELTFTLEQPNASLLYSLAIFPAFIVSPTALEKYGEDFQRRPVGTGPFEFVEWRPNEAIIMKRNETYWGRKASIERLVLSVVPDSTARLLKLKSGEINGMDGLQPAEIDNLETDPGVTVYQETGLNVGYMCFNLEKPRMQNLELRRGISMAIDRDALAKVGLSGAGRSAHYPLPEGFLGYPTQPDSLPFDLGKAKTLLAPFAAEFRKEPLELLVMNAPRPYFPDPIVIATFIKGQLEAAGLSVKIVSSDFKAQLSSLRNGDYEAGLIGWVGDNGDTDNFLSVFFASWAAVKGTATNYSFYRNDEMDALLRKGRIETDSDRRSEVYGKVIDLWRKDLPLIPLVHADNIAAIDSHFDGFELQKIGDLRLAPLMLRSNGN